MGEKILVCEDSVEGVLTAVYQAYAWKLAPEEVRIQIGEADLFLFAEYREVHTDRQLAGKVASTVERRFGEDAWESICYALASEDREKGQAVYRTIAAGLSGRIRGKLMEGIADDNIRRVFELSRHVHNEANRMLEFLRFREVEGKVMFARIEPGADVVALIMPHFADRFPLENFVIADTRRGMAGIHAAQKEWFLVHMDAASGQELESLAGLYTEEETQMAALFKHFCKTIEIKPRRNPKLQRQLLPMKYRGFMTEFEASSVSL